MIGSKGHGRVIAVNDVKLGSELASDTAAAAASLWVEDAADFDERGGTLIIAGQILDYTAVDDDTGEIKLASTLPAPAAEGTRVDLYSRLYQQTSSERIAQVELDGDDNNADALEVTIAHHLVDQLPLGIRSTTGESVLLELDGDEWRIVDVLGTAATAIESAAVHFTDDTFTLAQADGSDTLTLSYEPLAGSEHLLWHPASGAGINQEQGVSWNRAGRTIRLGAGGAPGDTVIVEYAYNAIIDPDAPPVDWASGDWQILQTDATDTVDRSAPAYDDSTWTTADAPFGSDTEPHPLGWYAPVTLWADNTALWIRKHVYLDATAGVPDNTLYLGCPIGDVLRVRMETYLDPTGRTYARPHDGTVRTLEKWTFYFDDDFVPDQGLYFQVHTDRFRSTGQRYTYGVYSITGNQVDDSANPAWADEEGAARYDPNSEFYGANIIGVSIAYGVSVGSGDDLNGGPASLGVNNAADGQWYFGNTIADGQTTAGPIDFGGDGAGTALITARVDDKATIYWNGTPIGSTTGAGTIGPIEVTGEQDNVLAARGEDINGLSYLDVAVAIAADTPAGGEAAGVLQRLHPSGIAPAATDRHVLTTVGGEAVWQPPNVVLIESTTTTAELVGLPTGTIIIRKATP